MKKDLKFILFENLHNYMILCAMGDMFNINNPIPEIQAKTLIKVLKEADLLEEYRIFQKIINKECYTC